jgi:hypothetical protein
MTLTPFPQLFMYIGMTLSFTAALAVASLFVFRRRHADWQKLKVVSFAWPLVPAVFILMSIWMTIYGIVLKPRISGIAIATVLIGAIVYHIRIRSRAITTA